MHPLFAMILGFLVWSAAFLLLYGVQATGCHLGWHQAPLWGSVSALRAILAAIVLVALVATLIVAFRVRRIAGDEVDAFAGNVAVYVAIAAFVSTGFCLMGVFWLTLCTV